MRARHRLRPRQYVPAAFVLTLGLSALGAPAFGLALGVFELVLGAYALVVLAAALPALWRHGPGVALALAAALPVMHLTYGVGFLRGVVHFAILKRAPESAVPALSR